jgi:hypothetical protein
VGATTLSDLRGQELRTILDRLVGIQAMIDRASTPGEAAAAAAILQAQMAKYNLTSMELRQAAATHDVGSGRRKRKASDGFASAPLDFGSSTKWLTEWKQWILNAVCEANYARCVIHRRNGMPDQATIIAREDAVMYIVSMYDYLIEAVRRMCNDAFRDYSRVLRGTKSEYRTRKWRSSFYMGASNKIRERLMHERRSQEELQTNSSALVTLEDAELDQAIAEMFPKLREGKTRTVTVDFEGYDRGQRAGDKVNLDPQVRAGR